ncbi:MAG: class I SAM-dependent methyltransferase [Longimonas sp.]|uniref:class I SAM-dependent methyltransferase n=1 Tax=Longimonas sp. TaxID=2039626 RepID=UPI0033576A2D
MARSATTTDPAQRMDRMYRYTRHIYDWTRRPYLLGRDRVLQDMAARPAGHVLEMGCGTARNLRVLHEQAPHHTLYGLDASEAMLNTARATASPEVQHAMCLKQGLAQSVEPRMFGRAAPFDMVLCSYVLSMIPNASAAVDAALNVLAPGGRLYLVDFWDQANWPAPLRWVLQRWLSWFGVHHRPALHAHLDDLAARKRIRLTRTPIAHRYAYQAVAVKAVS